MKITFQILGLAILSAIILTLTAWVWLVMHKFNLANPWTELPNGLINTFDYPVLRPIAWQSLLFGFGTIGVMLYVLGDWSESDERVLRGDRIVTGKELARMTQAESLQVTVADVPLPIDCETQHLLLTGSTGTGKTTALNELRGKILKRGDRMIVIDPDGYAFSRFAKVGDRVLNPFDKRSPGWSIFNEIRSNYDYDRISRSVVPDSTESTSQSWHGYAQQLLAGIMRTMLRSGENTTERLLYWVKYASAKELSDFLSGSVASGLFEPGAEKAFASTRFILSYYVGPYEHLQAGNFSLRNWLESEKGNLYITWNESMRDSLKPLISTWADVLIDAKLTLPTKNASPLWLDLDELSGLERLNSLEAGLTRGRKHNLRILAGLQSVAQLDERYGKNVAQTLRSCFRNVLALGGSNTDPDTAETISKGLGQVEVERKTLNHNRGPNGISTNSQIQRNVEYLVLPTELMSLKPLHGFLKLAGKYPVGYVQLVQHDLPVRILPFIEL